MSKFHIVVRTANGAEYVAAGVVSGSINRAHFPQERMQFVDEDDARHMADKLNSRGYKDCFGGKPKKVWAERIGAWPRSPGVTPAPEPPPPPPAAAAAAMPPPKEFEWTARVFSDPFSLHIMKATQDKDGLIRVNDLKGNEYPELRASELWGGLKELLGWMRSHPTCRRIILDRDAIE